MFFERFKQDNTRQQSRPTVKKVSELIDKTSHEQKKYLSLMLVPSYSTGKTRSLRIPRGVFHGMLIGMLVFSAVVTGFYLRSNHFMRMAQELYQERDEIAETLAETQHMAEVVQSDLINSMIQVYERYSEVQQNTQSRLENQAREHQTVLDGLWDQVDEFEQLIRELEEDQQAVLEGLSSRADKIPPIASLLNQLEESREYLLAQFERENVSEQPDMVGIGLLSAGTGFLSYTDKVAASEAELQLRITTLAQELTLQRKLLDDLNTHSQRIRTYLYNYPTLWPVTGRISSDFGWRRRPLGGGSEHHNGVDIPARTGTPIRAAGGGTVTFSGWQNGYGQTVIIDHGGGITTAYTHNSRNNVEVGHRVTRGQIIAYVGSTGRTTGAHLHYEVRINNAAVDPIPFMVEH